jgi:hypothetical protein
MEASGPTAEVAEENEEDTGRRGKTEEDPSPAPAPPHLAAEEHARAAQQQRARDLARPPAVPGTVQAVAVEAQVQEPSVPPQYVRLDVGGTRYTTLLSTLCKHPDSMLAKMFQGTIYVTISAEGPLSVEFQVQDEGHGKDMTLIRVSEEGTGYAAGLRCGMRLRLIQGEALSDNFKANMQRFHVSRPLQLQLDPPRGQFVLSELQGLAKDSEGAYILDRDGPCFRHVLNYLRHEGVGLPPLPVGEEERLLLATEADYYVLPELAQLCRAGFARAGPLDMSGMNLAGRDLSGRDLSGANLSGSDLSAADLSGSNLTNANLSRCKVERTNFDGATMLQPGTKLDETVGKLARTKDITLAVGVRVLWQTAQTERFGRNDPQWREPTDDEDYLVRVSYNTRQVYNGPMRTGVLAADRSAVSKTVEVGSAVEWRHAPRSVDTVSTLRGARKYKPEYTYAEADKEMRAKSRGDWMEGWVTSLNPLRITYSLRDDPSDDAPTIEVVEGQRARGIPAWDSVRGAVDPPGTRVGEYELRLLSPARQAEVDVLVADRKAEMKTPEAESDAKGTEERAGVGARGKKNKERQHLIIVWDDDGTSTRLPKSKTSSGWQGLAVCLSKEAGGGAPSVSCC